jgi:hypothetical protein
MIQVLKYILKERLNKLVNICGFFPSLWEGLGEGAKLDAHKALSPALSQSEREKDCKLIKSIWALSSSLSPNWRGSLTVRLGIVFFLLIVPVHATSINDYYKHITQAITALDSLAQIANENETTPAFEVRTAETISSVLQLLPASETVELGQQRFTVDNSWLQTQLEKYKNASATERPVLREQVIERLQAIRERINEVDSSASEKYDKDQKTKKLAEILQRPEYARKVKQQSAIGRLWEQFVKWLANLFPKPKPIAPGTAGIFSKIAQVFVIALAVAVLIFVARLFLPRLLQNRRTKRKVKEGPRIVLGERLEPDQSATDLLSEAEALARGGDLRAAIRKAYIALLLELGERKIITLEQHKTNHDYLRAVRSVERLYPNVKQLTDSFELHWYGLARATETDWQAFRSGYKQALSN